MNSFNKSSAICSRIRSRLRTLNNFKSVHNRYVDKSINEIPCVRPSEKDKKQRFVLVAYQQNPQNAPKTYR